MAASQFLRLGVVNPPFWGGVLAPVCSGYAFFAIKNARLLNSHLFSHNSYSYREIQNLNQDRL